jgi:hypothetical protein
MSCYSSTIRKIERAIVIVNFDRTIALIENSTLLRLLFYYQAAYWLFLIDTKRDLTFSFEDFLYSHWYC